MENNYLRYKKLMEKLNSGENLSTGGRSAHNFDRRQKPIGGATVQTFPTCYELLTLVRLRIFIFIFSLNLKNKECIARVIK